MSERECGVDPFPETKAGYATAIFLLGLLLTYCLAITVAHVFRDFDLYLHGKVATGIVKATQERAGGRDGESNASSKTIYMYNISYDGLEKIIASTDKIPIGAKVEVYYSTLSPAEATILTSEQPFKNIVQIFLTAQFQLSALVIFLLSLIMGLLVRQFRRAPHELPDV